MRDVTRHRAQAALAWRKPVAAVDIAGLEAELASVMRDAPHGPN